MKIKNYKLKATIPTVSYGNLQPEIEVDSTDIGKASEFALNHIKELHSRFSDKELNETVHSVSESIKMKSFNEDVELDFDVRAHKYTFDGKALESGSKFASKFYKPFDAQGVAKNCEKSWGVKATEITDMWDSNGTLTSEFGTVVHKALEHYFNHRDTAYTISDNKDDDENRAMPKHPILKSIIEGFLDVDKAVGEFVSEALVTDVKGGRCGQIDRLVIVDEKKKICDINDYKVNFGSEDESSNLKALEPYDKLPKNKLTKYYIQMKFYKEVLEATGWSVRNLTAYVYENEWKVFDLTNLENE